MHEQHRLALPVRAGRTPRALLLVAALVGVAVAMAACNAPGDPAPTATVGARDATASVSAASVVAGPAGDATSVPSDAALANFWLARYVEKQVPVLVDPAASDWVKVEALRKWTYQAVDKADEACLLDHDYGPRIAYDLPAAMALLLENKGGFYCGGTAYMLTGLYRLFGFTSYAYNMGQLDGPYSHVVSLVEVQTEAGKVLAVEDAYLNYTLLEGGKPIDFARLIALLGARRADRVEVATTFGACKPLLIQMEDEAEAVASLRKFYDVTRVGDDGERAAYCHNFTLETIGMGPGFAGWVREHTGETNFLYLYLFPLGTSGEARAEALMAEALAAGKALAPVP